MYIYDLNQIKYIDSIKIITRDNDIIGEFRYDNLLYHELRVSELQYLNNNNCKRIFKRIRYTYHSKDPQRKEIRKILS